MTKMADDTKKELRSKLIYQVFVRNYSKDGTFASVERDLDRIKSLGTDIVYFLPIHPIGKKCRKGVLGSPYAISDYRAVNPEYGTMDDFKGLVNSIHEKGMKCMIDVVYNHTSPDSLLSKEHPEWFYHKQNGDFGNRVGDWSDIIDLDYSQKGLWDYQIETLMQWAKIVDGFRCDVAPLVPLGFWVSARKAVSQIKPDFIWLSESVDPSFITYLRGRGMTALSDGEIFRAFDISYDYDIYGLWKSYLEDGESLAKYVEAVNRQEYIYPDNYIKLRFLENHDQERARSFIRDERALRVCTAFMLFQKGASFVYAGQEFGASHRPSLFDKDTVNMKPEDSVDLTNLIKTMSQLKKDEIFSLGSYSVKAHGNDFLSAQYTYGERRALGLFPLKAQRGSFPADIPDGIYRNEVTCEKTEVSGSCVNCSGEAIILFL